MKKTRAVIVIFLFLTVMNGICEDSKKPSFHLGLYDEIGFFSNYSGITLGFDGRIWNTKVGIHQKVAYGLANQEIAGITDVRFFPHEQIFVNLGASYLLSESRKGIDKDFNTLVLPVVGFGCYLPVKNTRVLIVPKIQMNQSFYLTDDTSEIFTDMPFIIAMTVGIGVELQW